MMKATLQGAVLLGLLAASTPSFAEVQNVKVGGDLTVRAFHRENLDLRAESGTLDDEDDFLMSTIGINIGADLTENVSTFLRLASERDWDTTAGESANDFDLSQAYVTLKELFYSPLTVRIGLQPIVWGRGFVIGSNLLPSVIGAGGDRNASISANEYTDFTAFDAIRATLDLSNIGGIAMPLTADYVYIKLDENSIGEGNDVTLTGLNLSTKFDSMSSELETYYLFKHDEAVTPLPAPTATVNPDASAPNDGSIHTIGLRGSAQPGSGNYAYGEIAYQWGTRTTDNEFIQVKGGSHSAWAADFGADHTFADIATTPKLGGEWIYYSGNNCDGACGGWDTLARGYYTTAIREFMTRDTVTSTGFPGGAAIFYPTAQSGVTSGATNQHQLALYGGLKPLEDLSVNSRTTWFFLPVGAKPPTSAAGSGKRETYLGWEWDTVFTYDYTDDVQFGFLYALFVPGNVFKDVGGSACASTTSQSALCGGQNTAQELVTTVSVKF